MQNMNEMKEKLIELNIQKAVNEAKDLQSRKRKLPLPAATRKSSRLAAASRAEDREMSPSGGGETGDQFSPPRAEQPRARQPRAAPTCSWPTLQNYVAAALLPRFKIINLTVVPRTLSNC